MTYKEFMWNVHEYINMLEEPIQNGTADLLIAEEWAAWIAQDAKACGEDLDAEQIGWIVEKLGEDGFVKEA